MRRTETHKAAKGREPRDMRRVERAEEQARTVKQTIQTSRTFTGQKKLERKLWDERDRQTDRQTDRPKQEYGERCRGSRRKQGNTTREIWHHGEIEVTLTPKEARQTGEGDVREVVINKRKSMRFSLAEE